ncbi:unnamed protein product [Somion occarium]|uniref:Carbohydrate kinase PfkB domain-containing protein n=1 Tax=Somion occarium TaxID=3059160 RepID=A0ABP1D349_9APHY
MAPFTTRHFVSLGMFIIDELDFDDGRTSREQIGGGGTYAAIGARMWLPADKVGMIVDRGHDFLPEVQAKLERYGKDMWYFRDDKSRITTRARNSYIGDSRGFEYLTPRVRLTPRDLEDTPLAKPSTLHFICSPSRAIAIMSEVHGIPDWRPITIYEPIPDRCVPEELPALISVMPHIDILSPNADEALALLSLPGPVDKSNVEAACHRFLDIGVGKDGTGCIAIRSGSFGAYIATRGNGGKWVDAYWTKENSSHVVDVTGAGNAFLGGLSAGLYFTEGNPYQAALYGAVSASFVIEQEGLPSLTSSTVGAGVPELWNNELPATRLARLRERLHE